MKKIILKSLKKIDGLLNLKNLSLMNEKKINTRNIGQILLIYKNKEIKLSEIFSIKIIENKKEENEINVKGCNSFCNYLGYKWKKDILTVESNLGSYVGKKMQGGEIRVKGSVEDFLGSGMLGGKIIIRGNAKDYVGSASFGEKTGMNGGEIFISGDIGKYACNFMRRGFVIIKGNVDAYCCFNMISGTLIAFGNVEKNFGISMRRGTLIFYKANFVDVNNFIKSGEFDFSYIRLIETYLFKEYLIKFPKKNIRFIKYSGDKNLSGLGEIFIKNI